MDSQVGTAASVVKETAEEVKKRQGEKEKEKEKEKKDK
jgi:hypothetical protein